MRLDRGIVEELVRVAARVLRPAPAFDANAIAATRAMVEFGSLHGMLIGSPRPHRRSELCRVDSMLPALET